MTPHRSLARLTLPFHVFLNKCLPVGLTDHLICLLRGAGRDWESRKVSVRQVNVLITAVTCSAPWVENAATGFQNLGGFTGDINYRGLGCLCALRNARNVEQWLALE